MYQPSTHNCWVGVGQQYIYEGTSDQLSNALVHLSLCGLPFHIDSIEHFSMYNGSYLRMIVRIQPVTPYYDDSQRQFNMTHIPANLQTHDTDYTHSTNDTSHKRHDVSLSSPSPSNASTHSDNSSKSSLMILSEAATMEDASDFCDTANLGRQTPVCVFGHMTSI